MTSGSKSEGDGANRIRKLDLEVSRMMGTQQVVSSLHGACRELIDNALDSGATKIEIRTWDKGLTRLEVADDGCGIRAEDYEQLCKPHRTSKLRNMGDFNSLATFGFRGEALNALAQLGHVSIITRCATDKAATKMVFDENGSMVEQKLSHERRGTTVTVECLFEPSRSHIHQIRRVELERNINADFRRLMRTVQEFALGHTSVRFTLVDRKTQSTPGNPTTLISTMGGTSIRLRDVITKLFGSRREIGEVLEIREAMPTEEVKKHYSKGKKPICADGEGQNAAGEDEAEVPNSEEEIYNSIRLSGYVSACSAGQGRSSTDQQFFYLNRREVDYPKLGRIANQVYQLWNRDKYPMVVLKIEVDQKVLDVNVTPEKRKVNYKYENELFAKLHASLVHTYESAQGAPIVPNPRNRGTMGLDSSFASTSSAYSTGSAGLGGLLVVGDDTTCSKAKMDGKGHNGAPSKNEISTGAATASRRSRRGDEGEEEDGRRLANVPMGTFIPASMLLASTSGGVENSNLTTNHPISSTRLRHGSRKRLRSELHSSGSSQHSPEDCLSSASLCCAGESTRHPSKRHSLVLEGEKDATRRVMSNRCMVAESSKTETGDTGRKQQLDDEALFHRHGMFTTSGDPTRLAALLTSPLLEENAEWQEGDDEEMIGVKVKREHSSSPGSYSSGPEEYSEGDEEEEASTSTRQHGRIVVDTLELNMDLLEEQFHAFYPSRTGTTDSTTPMRNGGGRGQADEKESKVGEPIRWCVQPSQDMLMAMRNNNSRNAGNDGADSGEVAGTSKDVVEAVPLDARALRELSGMLSAADFAAMHAVGTFNKSLILALHPGRGELFLIDQHAADEKYLFEKYDKEKVLEPFACINPIPLKLGPLQEQVLRDNLKALARNGFRFTFDNEAEAGTQARITHIPGPQFNENDVEEILSVLDQNPGVVYRPGKALRMLATMACRDAVMFNDEISDEKAQQIIVHMGLMKQPWNCPHGRPTIRHVGTLRDGRKMNGTSSMDISVEDCLEENEAEARTGMKENLEP